MRQKLTSDCVCFLMQKYHVKSFCGGGKPFSLICHNNKIIVSISLQHDLIACYHAQLCHPGETQTEQTIQQHFWFPHLHELVHSVCSKCLICPKWKVSHMKYGHLPSKESEAEPWERLCVDLVGPYTIKHKGAEP
jgi:Integrase zinc binding domain